MSLKVFAKDFDLEYFGTRFHLEHFHILTTQEIGLPSLQTIYMCSQRIRASMSLIDSCLCVLLSACQCVCLCNCFGWRRLHRNEQWVGKVFRLKFIITLTSASNARCSLTYVDCQSSFNWKSLGIRMQCYFWPGKSFQNSIINVRRHGAI